MPIGRYFAWVGSLLYALLLIADWNFRKPVTENNWRDVDKTVIRIHSAHKWPERIDIDTSLPTIAPQQTAIANAAPIAKAARESFAKLIPPDLVRSSERPKVARRTVRDKIASYRPAAVVEALPAGW